MEGLKVITIAELLSEKEKIKQAEKQYKPKSQKKYLSKDDREELIMLAAIVSKLDDFIEIWLKLGRPRKRIKYAKTALTYVFKTMDSYFDDFTEIERDEAVRKIIKDFRECEIYLTRRV